MSFGLSLRKLSWIDAGQGLFATTFMFGLCAYGHFGLLAWRDHFRAAELRTLDQVREALIASLAAAIDRVEKRRGLTDRNRSQQVIAELTTLAGRVASCGARVDDALTPAAGRRPLQAI
jgi:hypothetical protein